MNHLKFVVVFATVAQAGFELTIFLPQPHDDWDYRDVPPHLV
jgi:hypothetical protein